MTGTDVLGARDTDTKLAVLLERSQNTERFISTIGVSLSNLGEAVGRIEKTQIQSIERLTAQAETAAAEVKRLDALIIHKDQSSISRDKQQVTLIRESEAERDRLLKEQEARHHKDMAELKVVITTINSKLDNAVFWSRIMAGVTGLATTVAGAVIIASLNKVFGG